MEIEELFNLENNKKIKLLEDYLRLMGLSLKEDIKMDGIAMIEGNIIKSIMVMRIYKNEKIRLILRFQHYYSYSYRDYIEAEIKINGNYKYSKRTNKVDELINWIIENI